MSIKTIKKFVVAELAARTQNPDTIKANAAKAKIRAAVIEHLAALHDKHMDAKGKSKLKIGAQMTSTAETGAKLLKIKPATLLKEARKGTSAGKSVDVKMPSRDRKPPSRKMPTARLVEHPDGTQQTLDTKGRPHSFGDEPSTVQHEGTKMWHKNGKLDREGGKPAFEGPDGEVRYYKDGVPHRGNGLPAVIKADGRTEYYKEGKRYFPGDKKLSDNPYQGTMF